MNRHSVICMHFISRNITLSRIICDNKIRYTTKAFVKKYLQMPLFVVKYEHNNIKEVNLWTRIRGEVKQSNISGGPCFNFFDRLV